MSIKKIAVLTSGGDSPGMNSAVRSVITSANRKGLETFVIYEGFAGMFSGNIKPIKPLEVKNWIGKGGTEIYSSRFPEFAKLKTRKVAVENLKKLEIDAVVVIGGDGSYMGAAKLTEMGIKTIGLPGTIDNDISSTTMTIGFDTALNTIIDAIDKMRDTSESHKRCIVVETMGNNSGYLAITAAIATGAEVLSCPEELLTQRQIVNQVEEARDKGNRSIIVIVTEKRYNITELAKKIEAELGIETRPTSLGHIQRGGAPLAYDRLLATRFGNEAVKLLLNGKTGQALGLVKDEIIAFDILEAVKIKRKNLKDLINKYKETR